MPEVRNHSFGEGFTDGPRDLLKRRRGRPRLPNPKQAVSLRLEPCVVEKFRATGPGWQRRMNDVLRRAVVEAQLGAPPAQSV